MFCKSIVSSVTICAISIFLCVVIKRKGKKVHVNLISCLFLKSTHCILSNWGEHLRILVTPL